MTNKYYPVWIGLALLLLLSATGCYSCGDLLPCHPNDPQFAPTQCPCLNDQGCPPHLLCRNQRCTPGASIEYPDTIGDTTNQDDHTQELSQDNDNQDNQKRDQAPDDLPPTDRIPPDSPSSCQDGQTSPCYTGPPETAGKGNCKAGERTCKDGQWGPCLGEILPRPEICNGRDDDCNGQIDENVDPCGCQIDGETLPCYNGPPGTETNKPCKTGILTCKDKQWGPCIGDIIPQPESCNNKDDDCDGKIDEIQRSCTSACGKGTESCKAGQWSACSAPVPTAESCNNKDDDCNGKIDDNLTRACYSGATNTNNIGECKEGKATCDKGKWSTCVGSILPTPEICDGKDNNCNGQIDEGNVCAGCTPATTQPCGSSTGACRAGTQTCQSDRTWGSCVGEVTPRAETCNDVDDNCDGQIDENLTRTCNTNCGSGTEVCTNGRWHNCTAPTPETEICDNLDNNCDGTVDEGLASRPCTDTCGPGTETCKAGRWICTGAATPEICDGLDTDCDGKIDVCTTGQTKCNGPWVERCNNTCEGWAPVNVCSIRCSSGACCLCNPGTKRCARGGIETCRSDCQGWNPAISVCNVAGCANGMCCSCPPSATRCLGDSVQECQSDCQTWVTTIDCTSSSNICENGLCVPPI